VATYAIGYAHPRLLPMAVLDRDGRSGISGVYVGESSSHVWIGQVVLDPSVPNHGRTRGGRIIELPRSQVGSLAIGPRLSLDEAVEQAPGLLDTLRSDRPSG